MGTLGIGVIDLMAFSLLSKSNLKIDGNQITFGTIDFQPHPLMTHKYRGSQQSSREVKPKFIDST
jgi:hypothetical protein